MAKLMFLGSIPGHVAGTDQEIKQEHEPLFVAARQLGEEAASRGHHTLVGSSSPRTVDAYVVRGVKDFCLANPDRIAHVEVHRPETEPASFEDMPDNVHFLPFSHYADPTSPHKWTVSHARALDHADVLITVGGGISTRLIGHLAVDRGKAVVAIPVFGGASEELFQALKYSYQDIGIDVGRLQSLLTTWQSDSPKEIIEIADQLHARNLTVIPHSYFLSYSWKDCRFADHVETLLRRELRPVLRDEVDIDAGGQVSLNVQAMIEDCDTFIALWSENFRQSSWCPKELEYAQNLHDSAAKPQRIVLLKLDDTPLPLRQSSQLCLEADQRKECELAALKLIRGEKLR